MRESERDAAAEADNVQPKKQLRYLREPSKSVARGDYGSTGTENSAAKFINKLNL